MKIRVLIVDDSPTARAILSEVLGNDPEIEVVGTARDGREGVEMTKRLRPDCVTMDIQMPVMDGFEATKEIMIEAPTPIVIVSTSTRVKEVETGMMALRAGALTLLLKPKGPTSPDFEATCREIVETVKTMSDVKVVRHHRRPSPAVQPAVPARLEAGIPLGIRAAGGFRAVAIAASTGGPPALNTLLGGLPTDFPLPILVVQHIAAGFVDGFAVWLNSVVPMTVKVAEHDEMTRPGTVYVAPHDRHLGVTRGGRILLSDDPAIDGFRPAGTCLFQSVAEAFGKNSVAVILTGMGQDGVDGLRAVHRAGGLTVAQDEQSSVVFGMPRVAIAEGLADAVVPIGGMSRHLLNLVACKTDSQ